MHDPNYAFRLLKSVFYLNSDLSVSVNPSIDYQICEFTSAFLVGFVYDISVMYDFVLNLCVLR